jgi:phospho-N-acetylmuramoyl-pentapeptide-transferase
MNGQNFLVFFISFFLGIFLFPYFIRFLKKFSLSQPIYNLAPAEHAKKSSTPTMGGIVILISLLLSSLLYIQNFDHNFYIVVLTLFSYGFIGFFDDYKKVKMRNNAALSPKVKFILQVIFALVIVKLISYSCANFTKIRVTNEFWVDLGWFYYLFAIFLIVGTSNAVNLTDGLDGLAILSSIISFLFLLVISLSRENSTITLFLLSAIGASLAFLWFNTKPAQIFMGDVGSLSIGAVLAIISILLKIELLLILFGSIYLIETISVILQVAYFKITSGKRLFKMAPIHHHFELKAVPEEKIVIRFFIISVLTSVLGIFLYFL